MDNIIELKENELVVDSRILSKGFNVEHRSVRRLIETHIKSFDRFGFHGFEIQRTKNGREERFCYLNEQQATFLISLMKNSEIVVEFKEKLIKDFYKMKSYLQNKSATLKQKSTKARNILTDEWQKHGVTSPKEYAYLTLEEYRLLQFEKGKRKKDFDDGELKTLMALEAMEMLSLHYNPVKGFIECKSNMRNTAQKVIDVKKHNKQPIT